MLAQEMTLLILGWLWKIRLIIYILEVVAIYTENLLELARGRGQAANKYSRSYLFRHASRLVLYHPRQFKRYRLPRLALRDLHKVVFNLSGGEVSIASVGH